MSNSLRGIDFAIGGAETFRIVNSLIMGRSGAQASLMRSIQSEVRERLARRADNEPFSVSKINDLIRIISRIL